MSEKEQSRYLPELERAELISLADATIGSLSGEEIGVFISALQSKSAKLLSIVRDREEFVDEDFIEFFGKFISSKKYARAILAGNGGAELTAAIKSLRVSSMDPGVSIRLFKSLKGADTAVLMDVAFESVHFLNPDMYGLCSRWVFNPENGRGALSSTVRGHVPSDFASRQMLLSEARKLLEEAGYSLNGFYCMDVICSLAYAGGIMGSKDSSMNSGGMEALFPNSTVLAAMILGIRREILAHT